MKKSSDMTKTNLIFENQNGLVVRRMAWNSSSLSVIHNKDTRRVEFVSSDEMKSLDESSFEFLTEISRSKFNKDGITLGQFGRLHLVEADSAAKLQPEVEEIPEEESRLKVFLKYSAISHVAVISVIILSAFIITKYFPSQPEPQVVQVFEQNRKVDFTKREIVKTAHKKITRQNVRKAKVANKTRVTKSFAKTSNKNKSKKVITRPGQSVRDMGALGVLGGMSKNSKGSGGLNLNAKTNNPGVGYGGAAAKGGYERGLVGKGLVQAGIGSGGSMQGFGGYGTKGKGGGKPGYGSQGVGGSSAGYFEPLSEESLIEGGLDQDQINAVIQRNIGQVIYCYEQGLQSQPKMSGRVAVKFVIGSVGSVSTANVANSSLGSKKVENCIVNKLRSWRFPRPVGNVDVRVTYPFMLKRLSQG
ncbi:MAG: AgmX/PglI C-terminal domain-containing protein [Bdellovibrionales bacterium]|nr:AgmX/PglI C-terminal domain-containing protein [Bdellovibrionales bacterium]